MRSFRAVRGIESLKVFKDWGLKPVKDGCVCRALRGRSLHRISFFGCISGSFLSPLFPPRGGHGFALAHQTEVRLSVHPPSQVADRKMTCHPQTSRCIIIMKRTGDRSVAGDPQRS
ncbi:uncharacterized protein [Macrobrachium rosenbergii]|uniref:uncharacterized protein n=1 Tax=Macrobrachium rosenbergii TaxID=79674 RepID=UPI0034D602ED